LGGGNKKNALKKTERAKAQTRAQTRPRQPGGKGTKKENGGRRRENPVKEIRNDLSKPRRLSKKIAGQEKNGKQTGGDE